MNLRLAGLLLSLAIPAGAAAQRPDGTDWRRLATAPDRTRLRAWRSAWGAALAMVRQDGAGAAMIAADAALFDPDRALAGAMPPAGDYECRLVRLGRRGGDVPRHGVEDWTRCRIGADAGLVMLAGRQRPVGQLYADTDARAIFLGSMTLADERPLDYGRDGGRDIIGLVERIGPARWRLVMPHPAYQSLLDLLDLRPAGQRGPDSAGKVAR